jgi:hypothetical protein
MTRARAIYALAVLLLLVPCLSTWGTATYVTVRYNVKVPGGTIPATMAGTATLYSAATTDPAFTIYKVDGAWSSTLGYLSWTLPAGSYCTFDIPGSPVPTGYYHIVDDVDHIILLNDLIPTSTAPAPTWSSLLVPYTGETGAMSWTHNVLTTGYITSTKTAFFNDISINYSDASSYMADWRALDVIGEDITGNSPGICLRTSAASSAPNKTASRIYATNDFGLVFYARSLALGSIMYHAALSKANGTWAAKRFGIASSFDSITSTPVIAATFLYSTDHVELDDPLQADGFSSHVTTGTAPYQCASTTLNSNLNADLLDGHHANEFITAESDPRLPVATTAGNILKASGSIWESWTPTYLSTEADGVVGNEVTNATTNGNLVRAGTGTSGDPYTLGLNSADPVNYAMVYIPDAPRPYGWPQAANGENYEMNAGTGTMGWTFHNIDGTGTDAGMGLYKGYDLITDDNGGSLETFAGKTLSTALTGDFDIVAKVGQLTSISGKIGLFVGTDNTSAGDGFACFVSVVSARLQGYTGQFTDYAAPAGTTTIARVSTINYVRLTRVGVNVTASFSYDGISWDFISTVTDPAGGGGVTTYAVAGIYSKLPAQTVPEVAAANVDWIRVK